MSVPRNGTLVVEEAATESSATLHDPLASESSGFVWGGRSQEVQEVCNPYNREGGPFTDTVFRVGQQVLV